jgi:hypothetical protein
VKEGEAKRDGGREERLDKDEVAGRTWMGLFLLNRSGPRF